MTEGNGQSTGRPDGLAPGPSRFEAVLEAATEFAIIGCDADGTINLFNEGAVRMLGYRPEEVVGLHTPLLIHDGAEVEARAAELGVAPGFDVFVEAGRTGEADTRVWTYVRKDGTRLPVSLTVNPVRGGDGAAAGFVGIGRDVSGELAALDEAKVAAERIWSAFEALPVPILVIGLADGTVLYANPPSEAVFALPKSELVGVPARELGSWPDPDDRRRMLDQIDEQGRAHRLSTRLRRADGGLRDVELSVSPIVWEGVDALLCAFQDVTEQRQAQDDLRAAKERADEASEAKSEFLSHMSHELRTPLNAVLGFAQLLEMRGLPPDVAEEVHHIRRGGEHLLDLINQVIDMARIEAGRLPISMESVSVGGVVDDAARLVTPMARDRRVSVTTDVDARLNVHADGQRLRQVLLNVLANAVKYNRPGGTVTVASSATVEAVEVVVSDTGIGIPPDRLSDVFVPFERLGREDSRIEGAGLGLALSAGLVDAMGGAISVESVLGEGSTFTIRLSRSDDASFAGVIPADLSWPSSAEGNATVLYIEDNLVNLRLIETVVARCPGIELLSAMQGRIGLDLARQHQPDLVLLDLHLPDLGGEDVLRELRTDPATASCPVVVVSADATPGRVQRLLDNGASDYVSKPIDVRRLLALFETAGRRASDRTADEVEGAG